MKVSADVVITVSIENLLMADDATEADIDLTLMSMASNPEADVQRTYELQNVQISIKDPPLRRPNEDDDEDGIGRP